MDKKLAIKSKVVKDNIVITMPIDLLVYICENRDEEDAIKILDKKEWAKEISKRVCDNIRVEEDGSDMFERLLDSCFTQIYEDGCECCASIAEMKERARETINFKTERIINEYKKKYKNK